MVLLRKTDMNSLHVMPITSPSFVLLVRQLKKHKNNADIFEIWLDKMRVKGDLAVIQSYFKKPMIAKSENLDLLKKGVKAGFHYVDVPHNLETDLAFKTLVKNKVAKVIRSYHNYERTPTQLDLMEKLKMMNDLGADLLKIATFVQSEEDSLTLLDLLTLPAYKGKLIITGMGDLSRDVRIKAPLHGSVFYYAPLFSHLASAPGQLTREELENEWDLL